MTNQQILDLADSLVAERFNNPKKDRILVGYWKSGFLDGYRQALGLPINESKRSLKESHGFDEENEYLLGLTVATNEYVLKDTFESEGLDVDWNYISKVSAELDFTIERKFAKEINHIAVEELHDDEGYHCTFWVRYDDAKVMKYLNNLHYFDDYRYGEFTAKLVDVNEICDNEIDKLGKKYDADILGILRECVSVWIEVPNKIA